MENEEKTISVAETIEVPMDKLIGEMLERLDKDKRLNALFISACHNFKKNVLIEDKDERLMLSLIVGWILNDLMEIRQNSQSKTLLDILENKKDKLSAFKCELDDGSEFIVQTDDENAIDNKFVKSIEKNTGKKVVSGFVKLTDEENEILSKKVKEHIGNQGV